MVCCPAQSPVRPLVNIPSPVCATASSGRCKVCSHVQPCVNAFVTGVLVVWQADVLLRDDKH